STIAPTTSTTTKPNRARSFVGQVSPTVVYSGCSRSLSRRSLCRPRRVDRRAGPDLLWPFPTISRSHTPAYGQACGSLACGCARVARVRGGCFGAGAFKETGGAQVLTVPLVAA